MSNNPKKAPKPKSAAVKGRIVQIGGETYHNGESAAQYLSIDSVTVLRRQAQRDPTSVPKGMKRYHIKRSGSANWNIVSSVPISDVSVGLYGHSWLKESDMKAYLQMHERKTPKVTLRTALQIGITNDMGNSRWYIGIGSPLFYAPVLAIKIVPDDGYKYAVSYRTIGGEIVEETMNCNRQVFSAIAIGRS
jgi:hypothetical protein